MIASEEQFTPAVNPEVAHRPILDRVQEWKTRLAMPFVVAGVAGLAIVGSFTGETTPADANEATTAAASPEAGGAMPAIGPAFYGSSRLGHTYRSTRLRPTANSYDDMIAYYGDSLYHPYEAVDFMIPEGRDVLAVTDGTIVINSEETDETPDAWQRRPGMFVVVDPVDPRLPFYAFKHLSQSNVVEGQRVQRGEVIGESGSTQSPNAHLHFDAHASATHDGFNTYEGQRNWGRMVFWQCGRQITLTPRNARMGDVINPQPTRAASIRNCGRQVTNR
jgi:murein DD-endopeptidase MepM/ murein hydrolase activator NlpD